MPDLTDPEVVENLAEYNDSFIGDTARDIQEESGEDKEEQEEERDSDQTQTSSKDPGSDGTLTNVEGEDGFRLTEEQLEEKRKKGETEDLAPATAGGGGSFTPEERRENRRDEIVDQATVFETEDGEAGLTGIEDSSGFRLSKDELRKRLKTGKTDDLAAAIPGQAGLDVESKNKLARELAIEKQKERQRQNNLTQRSKSKQSIKSEVEEFAENSDVKLPPSFRSPQPNIITGSANQRNQNVFSTQREFASGTNIANESFLQRDASFSGLPGTDIKPASTFVTPTGIGFNVKKETENLLQDAGVPSQASENIGTSLGSTTTLTLGAAQGASQLPEDVKELIEDPGAKVSEEVSNFRKANTGQLSSNPETAALLAGSTFQTQAKLGQEALGAGIALGGIASAGSGVASGGLVRGVNAPTIGRRNLDTDVEVFQGKEFSNRLDSKNTEVTPSGKISNQQQFETLDAQGQTVGIIGEDKTIGKSQQPQVFAKINDPQGDQRLFTGTVESAFEATDSETKGLAETRLLEIGENNELKDIGEFDREIKLQDFRFETRSDVQGKGTVLTEDGKIALKDREQAVFGEVGGEDVRGIARSDVKQDEVNLITDTFDRTKDAEKDSEVFVSEGKFVDNELVDERPGIEKRLNLDDGKRSLEELSEEQQRQVLQDAQSISDEIFTDSDKQAGRNVDGDASDDIIDSGKDTGGDQKLIVESDRKTDTDVEEQRLGIGVDRVNKEAVEQSLRDRIDSEFLTEKRGLKTGDFGLSGSASTTLGLESETGTVSGLEQGQDKIRDDGQKDRPRNEPGEKIFEETEQETGQILEVGQDQDQDLGQDQDRDLFFRSEKPDPLLGGSGIPAGGAGRGREGDENEDEGFFGDRSREDEQLELRESVGAEVLGLEGEVTAEEAESSRLAQEGVSRFQDPLNLRSFKETEKERDRTVI